MNEFGKDGIENIILFAPFGLYDPEALEGSRLVREVLIPPIIWSCCLLTSPLGRAVMFFLLVTDKKFK